MEPNHKNLSKTQSVTIKSKEDVKLHVADQLRKWILRPASMLLGHRGTEELHGLELKPSKTSSNPSTSASQKLGCLHSLQKFIFGMSEKPTFIQMLHFGKAKPLCWKGKKSIWRKQKKNLNY